jgi:DNA-binding transcriptional LysR family regulator
LNEIINYPLILQRKPANTRAFLDSFMEQNDITLKPIMDLASYTLVVEFTRIGLGVGYATKEYLKKHLDDKELFEIKTTPSVPKRELGLILMEHSLPSFSAKKLIDIILDDCQKSKQ